MPIIEYGQNLLSFLSQTWHIWLVFAIVVLVGYCWYWYLFAQRVYKAIDHKAFVRHGRLGKWVNVEEHLHNDHSIDTGVKP